MINKLNTQEANKLFYKDNWFQPMMFLSSYNVKDLTINLVTKYLKSKEIYYELDFNSSYNDDNFTINVSSTNEYDLCRISKRVGTHFYTDHVHNKVYSVAYLDNPPAYSNEIIINIEHDDGWLVNDKAWTSWISNRFNTEEDIQELRYDKLAILLKEDVDVNMSEDFNFHLIRHIKIFNKKYKNSFVTSVYDFYKRKGYITKRQLDSLKEIMYLDKGYLY